MNEKESLQKIEDYYVDRGFSGEKLREVLEKDNKYQKLLKEKKSKRLQKYKINNNEAKKYVLSTDKDIEILKNCKRLKKLRLTTFDREMIELIISQLKEDWRTPLISKIKKLNKKYKI